MTADKTVEQLKSRGHYRVLFRPTEYKAATHSLKECRDLVETNKVSLRGWDYPHFPREPELSPGANYYEGWTNWSGYKELWRLYQSQQFVLLRGLREDWAAESQFQDSATKPGDVLNLIGSLVYEITELCEFLARLRVSGLYSDGVSLHVELNGTKGRRVVIDDRRRLPLFNEYRCHIDRIKYYEGIGASALVPGIPELAIRIVRYVLERFGWHNPSAALIDQEIEAYLQRRARR